MSAFHGPLGPKKRHDPWFRLDESPGELGRLNGENRPIIYEVSKAFATRDLGLLVSYLIALAGSVREASLYSGLDLDRGPVEKVISEIERREQGLNSRRRELALSRARATIPGKPPKDK